jgi:hypothetical protein
MKIFDIQLRKPSFNEVTAAAVMALGIWLMAVELLKASGSPLSRVDAGAALLVVFWGCVCVRLGIRVDRGLAHLALNVFFGGAIVLVYQALVSLFV